MKARTRAQRRRFKQGRPRIEGLERTPEGRISRNADQNAAREEESAKEAMETVIAMRERQHGAPDKTAKQPEWGYVLGRIYLDGKLGHGNLAKMRLEAGNRYAKLVGRYYGLTGIPFPSPRAQSLFSVHGFDGDDSEARAEAAKKASNSIMILEGELLRCREGRQVSSTVKNVCVMDLDEARGWPFHMLEYLRRGLDALIIAFGLQDHGKSDIKDESQ